MNISTMEGERIKALVMDGTRSMDHVAKDVLSMTSKTLVENGYTLEILTLDGMDIEECTGCFSCWIRTPGICVIEDDGRDVAMKMMNCDLFVWVTPIIFGGHSYHLKKAIDRLIPNIQPFFIKFEGETRHQKRYDTYPRILAIGILDTENEEERTIFRRLVARNAINMHAPSFSVGVVSRSYDQEEIEIAISSALGEMG